MLLIESNFETQAVLEESATPGKKNWFVKGIFMQADVNNRNRRNYPKSVMESEIGNYNRDFVKTRRAVGELSHPSTPEINLDRVSHIIEDIQQDGNNYIGRARILSATPMGQIAAGLLEGGVQIGVSSRATGSVVSKGGIDVVQPDFKLAAVDIVYAPSAPDAFVQGLMEGHKFVWDTTSEMDIQILEGLKKKIQTTPTANLQEATVLAFATIMKRLGRNK